MWEWGYYVWGGGVLLSYRSVIIAQVYPLGRIFGIDGYWDASLWL